MLNKLTNILLPKKSPQRKIVKKILVRLKLKNPHAADYYNLWTNQQRLYAPLEQMCDTDQNGDIKMSIVVPTYNPKEQHFAELIYSVMSQSYSNWELIISDASTTQAAQAMIQDYAAHDVRIKVYSNKTKGISLNTNYGLQFTTGDYIIFCDHDDTLDSFALSEAVKAIKNSGAELIYSDEDKVSDDGEVYYDPHYKPDWSPDLLTHVNYMNHLTIVKKQLLDRVGYLDPSKDGAQDYDLLLRLTDENPKICHIAKVLYHWRSTEGSTAQDFGSKKNVTNAGVHALEEHFARKGVAVRVLAQDDRPGFYDLKFKPFEKVAIIIQPFVSDATLLLFTRLLLKKTKNSHTKIDLIVPNNLNLNIDDKNISVIKIQPNEQFIESALMKTKASVAVFINQVYLPGSDDWLETLTGVLDQKHIKAVSPVIIQDNGEVQDCGLVRDGYGNITKLFVGQPATNNQTFFGNTSWVRDVNGLTGDIVAVRRDELLDFLHSQTQEVTDDLITKFSLYESKTASYNVVYTPVVFKNHSISLALRPNQESIYFNRNLLTSNTKDYGLYSPEATVTNILMGIADAEGLSI